MMTVHPAPHVVFAQTEGEPGQPGEEGGEAVAETPEEEPVEEEPVQVEGQDGEDSEDGESGTDGASGNPDEEDPQEGEDGEDTENEEDAADEEEEQGPTDGDTSIVTGDAESVGDLQNNVDLSILNTEDDEPCTEFCPIFLDYVYYDRESGTYKTSNPESQWKLDLALEDGILDPQEYLEIITPESDTTASTTNEAIVDNEVEVEAETGENEASGNHNVVIDTGNSTAVANVLNVVNTNIFDSEGFFLFLDNLTNDGVQGDLDFRDFEFFNPENVQEENNTREGTSNPFGALCPTCGGDGDLTINTEQTAGITNDVVVRSGSGINEAHNNTGDVSITTGDAYAAANTINLANTNIVDSNYLLLTFNNYGDYNDDIIFPSADSFMDMFATGGQTTPEQVNVNNTNTAGIGNNADVGAETGTNTAHGNLDGGSISTGDASASNNTLNQINSNLFGGSSFSILVKVHGDWHGDVIGIPDDMEWYETEDGIQLVYDSEGTGGAGGYDAINVTQDNAAQINNNISVLALTGENKIENAGGEASIETGDAFAAANTINVANTNVIGKNWMMAVINIFGDWTGDISFGEANLWIGAKANIPENNPAPGTPFTYEYTVMNTGDAPATNVCLRNRFDHRYITLDVLNPVTDRQISAGEVEYCIGTVEPGEVREVVRGARIANDIPYGTTYLENNIEVGGSAAESNMEDNEEVVIFDVFKQPPQTYNTGRKVVYKPSPQLTVSKVNASPFFVRASSTVDYRVIVRNEGAGSSYNSVLIDTLYNEDGEKVYEERWNLGEIYAGEEIEVFYTTYFNAATEAGVYTNVAQVEAIGGYHTWTYGHDATSEPAESSIKIVPYVPTIIAPEVIEVIEESVEIVETTPTSTEAVQEESEEVVEEENDEPIIVAVAAPSIVPVFGPFHGPFYYEYNETNTASAIQSLFAGLAYDHPQFGNHPVHTIVLTDLHDHPQFGMHPVYSKHTLLRTKEERDQANALAEFAAGIGFIKLLSLPFETLSFETESENESDGEGERILALLALSMFVLRKPKKKF